MTKEVRLLFLLKDHRGGAIIMVQAGTQAEADDFGRTHLPDFADAIEIDAASRREAEEFWGVRTVRLVSVRLDPAEQSSRTATAVAERPSSLSAKMPATVVSTRLWLRRPRLPDEVENSGLLTKEDLRDVTLDHIRLTSVFIGRIEIVKRG